MLHGNMSAIHIHSLLDEEEWDLDELKGLLEYDNSGVDTDNEEGKTPLLRVLEHENCTLDFVRLLLNYGADANRRAECDRYPMSSALVYSRQEDIIKELLDKGANPKAQYYNRSSLCISFEFSSIGVVKLFLNAGCDLHACRMHTSLLHCALNYTRSKCSIEILKLLIATGTDINKLDRQEQSILCFALQGGASVDHIQILFSAGALSACKTHTTPFHCATSNTFATPFREGVVKLLLDRGICPYTVNNFKQSPLQRALQYSECDTGAIKLLLDLPKMNDIINEQNLLHHAVPNHTCTPSLLNLLIDRGARLDHKDGQGETPLHLAAREGRPGIIKRLLERGADVNAHDRMEMTPLWQAVKWERDANILKMLFMFGAYIGSNTFRALQIIEGNSEGIGDVETQACFNMMTKMSLLENPDLDLNLVTEYDIRIQPFLNYAAAVKRELQKMDEDHGSSLRKFIGAYRLADSNQLEVDTYDVDQILQMRPDINFPIFFDIFAARVGKIAIQQKMQEVRVYNGLGPTTGSNRRYNYVDEFLAAEKQVVLNYEAVCELIKYLDEIDALRMAMAFYKPPNDEPYVPCN